MPATAEQGQEEALKRMMKMVNSFLSRPDSGPFREPVDWRGLELYDYLQVCPTPMDLGTVKRNLERGRYASFHEAAVDVRFVWNNCMTYNENGSDFWLLAKAFSKRFEDRYRRVKAEFDLADSESDEEEGEEDEVEEVEGGEDEEEDEDDEGAEEDDDEMEAEFQDDGDVSATALSATRRTSTGHGNSQNNAPSLDARAKLATHLLLLHGSELGHVVTLLEQKCPAAVETVGRIAGKLELNLDAVTADVLQELTEYTTTATAGRKGGTFAAGAIDDITSKRKRKK